MNWKRGSKYHLESDNGRFTIAKVQTPDGLRYELWNVARKQCVARYATAFEAKEAAELEDVF